MSSKSAKIAAAHGLGLLVVVALIAFTCSGDEADAPKLSQAAERGRETFAMHCSACHNARDPFADGIQGPGVGRASRELLEARIMRAEYPKDYTPKRPSQIMVALPHLKDRIDDLAAYLAEVPEPGGSATPK